MVKIIDTTKGQAKVKDDSQSSIPKYFDPVSGNQQDEERTDTLYKNSADYIDKIAERLDDDSETVSDSDIDTKNAPEEVLHVQDGNEDLD